MSTEEQTQRDTVMEPQAEITAASHTLEKLRHAVETMQEDASKSRARLQLDSDNLGENLLAVIEHLTKQRVDLERQVELQRQKLLQFTRDILHIIRGAREWEPELVPSNTTGASTMDSVFLSTDQNLNMFDLETDLVRNFRYPSDHCR
ncbi:MAG: hypothetical protein Q9196_000257 [Gyalolechia fulgens]